MGKKLVLVGLDGADWEIINPLVAEGALPNFARMISGGSHANLRSTIPALTAPAWRSMFTGVNPGKHGVFDFFKYDGSGIGLTSSKDTLAPYVWELMPDLKVLALNIPCFFPPRGREGAVVSSGFTTPTVQSDFTRPREAAQEIRSMAPDYSFHPAVAHLISMGCSMDKSVVKPPILRNVRDSKKIFSHFIESREWDAAFVVFSETDWMQHYYMSEFKAAERKSGTDIAAVYVEIDAFLGYLRGKGYDLVIVSDHGFREIRRFFFVNAYLMRKGLLARKREPLRKRLLRRAGLYWEDMMPLAHAIASRFMRPGSLASKVGSVFPAKNAPSSEIDRANTAAFLLSQGGCGVIVNGGASIERVSSALMAANGELGRPLIKKVLRREEVYWGDAAEKAPHLILVPGEGVMLKESLREDLIKEIDVFKGKNGAHRENGIFMAYGEGFKAAGALPDLSLLDIAPMVLRYFGQPVPAYMDGSAPQILSGPEVKETLKSGTRSSILRLVRKGRLGSGR
ncbi:MAG: alkaline phosphatase family protein [Candidatus Micrarchaeota archaeon]